MLAIYSSISESIYKFASCINELDAYVSGNTVKSLV